MLAYFFPTLLLLDKVMALPMPGIFPSAPVFIGTDLIEPILLLPEVSGVAASDALLLTSERPPDPPLSSLSTWSQPRLVIDLPSSSISIHPATATRTIALTTVAPSTVMSQGAASMTSERSEWNLPTSIANIGSAFAFSKYAWGASLASVVSAVPSQAFASHTGSLRGEEKMASPTPTGDVIAVLYPSGSANPAADPQGGVGFYSSPIDLSNANNVSLSYSVLFPANFDFVKGGKLPGVYGGHGACSGGVDASDCFSTRLMWRQEGAGELYLYAPRTKQTEDLCSTPPLTECDTDFGTSVGRGAFAFTKGAWNQVRQDIWLNTPGKADGGFNIWLNDKLVLSSDSVYYRNAPISNPPAPISHPPAQTTVLPPLTTSTPSQNGGLLGLGADLFGRSALWAIESASRIPSGIAAARSTAHHVRPSSLSGSSLAIRPFGPFSAAFTSLASDVIVSPVATALPDTNFVVKKPIGFLGIDAETFFGGKQKDGYASPKDQTAYFTKFALKVNSE